MEEPEKNLAFIFPEIIAVAVTAAATPYYLYKLLEKGHYVISGLGLIIWGIGVYFTIYALLKKNYILTMLPMLIILGAGYLVHSYMGEI